MTTSLDSGAGGPPSSQVRRERNIILGALLLLAGASWVLLLWRPYASTRMGLTMGLEASVFLLVWVIMMVAMMFPAAAPMVLIFARVQADRRRQRRTFVPTWIFVGAYLLIWLAAGATGFIGALVGERIGAGNTWLTINGARLAGALLILAGVYQVTPLKRMCLSRCRSPLAFVVSSWRDGHGGAVRMGLQHGLYCLGCCWLLFAILFPLGMMNVGLLAVLTLLIFAEKVLPRGDRIGWVGAVVLVTYGLAVMVSPGLLAILDGHQTIQL